MCKSIDINHIDLVGVSDDHCVLRGQFHELESGCTSAHAITLRVSNLILAEVSLA